MTEEPEETPKDDAAQHSARQSVRLSPGGRQGVRERSSSESRPGAFASKSKGAIDEPVHGGSETLSRIAVKSAERVGKRRICCKATSDRRKSSYEAMSRSLNS